MDLSKFDTMNFQTGWIHASEHGVTNNKILCYYSVL